MLGTASAATPGAARSPVQVELDAVDPEQLHRLYTDAIARFWDNSTFERVLDEEDGDRTWIGDVRALAVGGWSP